MKRFVKPSTYEKFSKEKDGILYYAGRILSTDEITIVGKMTSAMQDLKADTFCVPLIDKFSPLAYSIINEVHWYDDSVMHSGIESVWRFVLKRAFIIEGRDLVKLFKKNCQRCRYLNKKSIEVAMGPVSSQNLTIAPCFFCSQVDICGPFNAYSLHNKRSTIKIWLVVFCCSTTSATSIKVMENYSSSAFIQAFLRFSCNHGYPQILQTDEGSQLVKAFNSMQLNYIDIKHNLHQNVAVNFEVCPVGGHNMNGKVERKIREIKKSLNKLITNHRLSVIEWETMGSKIANSINNLPLALGNITSDYESMDLLTPNRLLLGRNNNRSPTGDMMVSNDYCKLTKQNTVVFESWFENWLLTHVPKLMFQPKWFNSDRDISEGDVILFLKNDSKLASTYQYGMVCAISPTKDGKIRKVTIKYRNFNENVFRFTQRAVRELVIIHHVDELSIYEQLYEMTI